jgi:hypothetical protein
MALSGAAKKVQQFVCGLHGHEMVRHFDKGRVSLQCVSCGHESPGWVTPDLIRRKAPDRAGGHGSPREQHAA